MFGAVWCALAAVSTQVGDPGAEEYFQGVALTRCKGTVTPDDEATAEHLVDELKKLATKMGRLLAASSSLLDQIVSVVLII